jgi:hypothetical protein
MNDMEEKNIKIDMNSLVGQIHHIAIPRHGDKDNYWWITGKILYINKQFIFIKPENRPMKVLNLEKVLEIR